MSPGAFVGRADELAVVDDCIDAVTCRRPRVVVCVGEAGIGKTRLAEEALTRAGARGMLAVWGIAETTSGAPPFWPWIRIVRALSRRLDLMRIASANGTAAALSSLAPEVFAPGREAHSSSVTADDRFRQFDALARLLRDVCEVTPLAIAVDDAHWADEASLLALTHVAAGLTDERLLLWVNAREVSPTLHGDVLSRMSHTSHARHLALRGLTAQAIREQLSGLIGRDVLDKDVDYARAATGGNPFLVGELARMLVDRDQHGGSIQPTRRVMDAVDARLRELPPMTAAAMRAASILGQEFDTTLVATMLGLAALDCAARLDDARRAGLIEPATAPGRHRFVHALVRDAVRSGVDADERVRLHGRAALAIEERSTPSLGTQVFAVAEHWANAAAADGGAQAAVWLQRAGDAAMRQLAYEDAAHFFAEALRLGGGSLDDAARCRLHLSRARAAGRCGALSTAFESVMSAAEMARSSARIDLLAESALAMEPAGIAGFDLAVRRLCQEVLPALGDDAPALRARLMARFAETYIYLPDPAAAREASLEALAVADAAGDNEAIASALRARQVVISDPEGLDEREVLMTRAVELGQTTGDASQEMRGRLGLVDAAFERGDLGRVAYEVEAAARCAADIGGPWARFKVLQVEAVLAQAQGRFDECRIATVSALDVTRAIDHHEPVLMRLAVLSAVARHTAPDEALLIAAGATEGAGAPDRELITAPGLIAAVSRADLLVNAGRIDEAARVFTALGPAESWRPPPHVVLLVSALGLDAALALGRSEDVAAIHDRLGRYRGHHVACGLVAASFHGPVELWLGKASLYLGRLDQAIADLDEAVTRCARSGQQGFLVESQAELAAALLTRGTPADATRARDIVAAVAPEAARLGMTPWSRRIAELIPALDGDRGGPLSRREREIAELVAEGLTNRQIAERLFLSGRTAQNHVQHILDKLGLSNRSQIAVWIERRRAESAPSGPN